MKKAAIFNQLLVTLLFFEASKDEEFQKVVEDRFGEYQESKKRLSGIGEDTLFQKNTSCSGLAPDIAKELEDNKLEFIFYSPTLNECIYSVSRSEDGEDNFTYRDYKTIYSGTTRKELGNYLVYVSYGYEDALGNTAEDFEDEIAENKKDYLDFVLENSLYNFDLLKDVSHIGSF